MFDGLTAAFLKRLVFDTAFPSCPPASIQFGKSRSSVGIKSMRFSTLSIAVASLVASFASADALPQPQFRAGILQCEGGQNVGFVVGSVASLECVFQSEGRRPEPYLATIRRFGLDLGVTDQTRLAWAVNAPTTSVGLVDLAGNYGGVGANASVGVGGRGKLQGGRPAKSHAGAPVSS